MIAGEPYDAYDPHLVAERRRARDLCRRYNGAGDEDEQRALLAELLGRYDPSAEVLPPLRCDYGWNISIGARCFVNFGCVILDTCAVTLGEHTLLGPSVHIYTAAHPLDAVERRVREYGRPVNIGDDVWIGGGAILCPGVNVGDRAVIGAGSIVTRDIPPDCVAAGNPCRVLRKLV